MNLRISIFEFQDYKKYILAHLSTLEGEGRGELSKIAKHLSLNRSFISQVLSGDRNLSREQAFLLGQYLGLEDLELRYLKELIDLERSSSVAFRTSIKKELEKIKAEAKAKEGQNPADQPLDERSQSIFYSDYKYVATQLLTGLPQFQTASAIAKKLNVDEKAIIPILNFLVSCGLCVTSDGKRFTVGTRKTLLDKASPFRSRHHLNWRIKAGESMSKQDAQDFFFTGPLRIDEATYQFILKSTRALVEEVKKQVETSSNETVACFNLDLFKI